MTDVNVNLDDYLADDDGHEHEHGPLRPEDVIREALAVEPHVSDLKVRTEIIAAALRQYGFLAAAEEVPEFNPEEAARFLAERSGFPRYTQVTDGWRKLLQSERDVEVASSYALRMASSAEVEAIRSTTAALKRWHQRSF